MATKKTTKRAAKKKAAKRAAKKKAAKGAAKKTTAKKTTAKKTTAKKTTAKRAAKKKPVAKKSAAAKKPAAAKSAPRKPTTERGAPATPSARERGMTLEDYLAGLAEPQSAIARRLVALVEDVAPGASPSIKWGQPVWDAYGPFAFLRGAARHVTLGFWRGADLDDPRGLLEGEGDRMKHVKVRDLASLDEDALRDFVDQAVRLNEERGDPTKRS